MDIALDTPAAAAASKSPRPRSKRRSMPMVVKLAYRNLFHDRLSFAVTIVGIVFSVVLVAVQTGIYLGSEKKIAAILDAAPADLWIVPLGTKSYDDPSLLSGRERHMALSTPGVENAEDMVVSFAKWRKPEGGQTTVLLVGSETISDRPLPPSVEAGSREALSAPDTVAID